MWDLIGNPEDRFSHNEAQLITGRSNVVVLLWMFVVCFCVRVSVTFHLTCIHIIVVRFLGLIAKSNITNSIFGCHNIALLYLLFHKKG